MLVSYTYIVLVMKLVNEGAQKKNYSTVTVENVLFEYTNELA